jgi:predicted nucleic acid-binding protein
MIVVDRSVLIGHLKGTENAQVALWQRLVRENDDQILIGDLILLEVLQGVGDEHQANRVQSALCRFEMATMLNPDLAIAAAAHYRHLRARGITIRKTIDLVIGTFCMAHDHMLLHCDREFEPLCQHLGLRTLSCFPH